MSARVTAWKGRAAALRTETHALWLASRDPRVPWCAKLVAAAIVAYAVSPIDLIPDFIPVVGHLDDLVLVPLGIALAIRLIPEPLLREHRERAAEAAGRPASRIGGAAVVAVWLLAASGLVLALRG